MLHQKYKQTFFGKAKRYLEPIFSEKLVTCKTILLYSLWGSTTVMHVIFIQKLVHAIELGSKELFLQNIILYCIFIVLYELLDFSMRKWGWVENINAYRKKIDEYYAGEFLQLENTEIEKQGTGSLVSIITRGSDVWALSLDEFIREIIRICIAFGFALYMVFQLGFLYGAGFMLIYLLIFFISSYFNSLSLIHRRERVKEWKEYTKSFVRIIMSKVEIMQSNKGNLEVSKLKKHANTMTHINKDMALSVFFCYRVGESSIIWLKAIALFVVGYQVIEGNMGLAFFVGIFAIFAFLETAIVSSTKFFRNFTKEFTTIEYLWNFFDTTPQIKGYDSGTDFQYKNGEIQLKNISYGYDSSKPVFQNFSLHIPGNRVTALVGPSGGGKSTLVKLISGYIRQDSGDILIDQQKLSDVSLKSYYKDIGYLTQEPSVFDGTIRENLSYAVETRLDERAIDEIIQLANCEFIYDFPQGLDTEIGERGVKLSGGQKQRLAIAKIFLKNPKIIILDEPTSALDSLSEQKITAAMHNLFKNRTVLVIAHRLQTVKYADDIIVIEGGEMRERGTHSTLVRKKGFYKQMLDLQSGF